MKNFVQIVLCLLLLSWDCVADAVPSQRDVLSGLFHERTKIERGCFEIVSTDSTVGHADVTWTWTIWLDGGNLRADVRRDGGIDVICVGCYGEYTRLFYTDKNPRDKDGKVQDGEVALSFYDGYSEPTALMTIPSPLWLGVHPCAFELLHVFQPASLLDIGRRVPSLVNPVTEADVAGKPTCWLVTIAQPEGSDDGNVYSYFVDRSDSTRIYRSEYRIGKDGEVFSAVIDVLEHYGKEYFYLPKKLKYVRKEQGKITSTSEISVNVVSLNEPLPENTFSPKGISFLKPGTPVMWALERDRPVKEGNLVWNGSEVVAEGTFELDRMMAESVRFKPVNMFFMLLGVALILFGIGLKLWKKYGT